MNIRIALVILFCQISMISSYCQVTIKNIDSTLSRIFKKLQKSNRDLISDSIGPLFKEQLKKYLLLPITFNNKLDSLETLITIKQSPDKKIKFYSWDELSGGSWHEMNAFAQFKTAGNKVSSQQIDTDEEMKEGGYTDSKIVEVNEIKENGKVYYVTFGWGTHGSGNQHMIIQVFRIVGNKLRKCPAFHPNQRELVIEYPRWKKLGLEFDKQTNSISFNYTKYYINL